MALLKGQGPRASRLLFALHTTKSDSVWFLLALLTLVAAALTIGRGSALLIAGTWCLALGFSRIIRHLGIPASWAIAIASEATVVLSLSGIVALLSPHEHGPAVNTLILCVPALLGISLFFIGYRVGRERATAQGFFNRVAVAVSAAVVLLLAALGAKGASYGVAWAMSGDARNHLLIMRTTIFNGGITVDQVRTYPAGFNALAAIVSGSTPRSQLSSGELLLHDIQALVGVYAVLIIAVACMIIAVLALFVSRPRRLTSAPGLPTTLVLVIAALAAVSPLLLGTTLVDGFFSAYGALALSLASVVIGLSALAPDRRGPFPYVFLAPAAVVLFISWTILAIVPISLAAFGAVIYTSRALRDRSPLDVRPGTIVRGLLFGLPLLSGIAIAVVVIQNLATLKSTFSLTGSTTPPNAWTLPIIALLLVSLIVVASRENRSLLLAALTVVIVGAAVALWIAHVPGGWQSLHWSYYSQKTLWLIIATVVWAPFVPLIYIANRLGVTRPPVRYGRTSLSLAIVGVAILVGLSLTTVVAEPISKAAKGWQQPTAEVMAKVISEADDDQPFVLWDYSDGGDDRLGNFWAALAWTTTPRGLYETDPVGLPGGFAYWAYFYTEQIKDLCTVVNAYPDITVVTRTADTSAELNESCGSGPYQVEVVEDGPLSNETSG